MQRQSARVDDLARPAWGAELNLPPSYPLIHRVSMGSIGVLCQLECEAAFRAEVLRSVPGYTDDPLASAEPVPTA